MTEMRVACIQLEAHDLEMAERSLEQALSMIDRASQNDPGLIVLPECTYPAYYVRSLEAYEKAELRPYDEVLDLFGERARRHTVHLVVGIARPPESGRLLNEACLFDPQGVLLGRFAKCFLWHFDQTWFDVGTEFPTFDLPFGRTGLFVCADGRMPEVPRLLALDGARLMVDTTAWVSGGGDRKTLSNAQYEYMIPTRAVENGTWVVVANKVGVEADTIVYCGRSCVVAPDGSIVAEASSDQAEVVVAEIDVDRAEGPAFNRRPELYHVLTEPLAELPAVELLEEPLVPTETVTRVAALQLRPYSATSAFIERVSELVRTLAQQDAELILLPGIPRGYEEREPYQVGQALEPFCDLSEELGIGLAFPLMSAAEGEQTKALYLVDRGEVVGRYQKSHLAGEEQGQLQPGSVLPVFETRYGRIGMMLDEEGLITEVPRSLMLQGADLILWPARASNLPLRTIGRSRADENKVFVALATPVGESAPPATALIAPSGKIMAAALPNIEQGVAGQMAWSATRLKEMAPNTNVVLNRQPASFSELTRT